MFVLVAGRTGGLIVVAASAAMLLSLALALAAPSLTGAVQQLLSVTALGIALVTLAYPLGSKVFQGETIPAAVRTTAVWPQILVTLFASRVLAELCDLRFSAFWREPLRPTRHPRTQSMLAALVLGLSFTLVFYQLTEGFVIEATRLDPLAIAWRAFTGQTPVHLAIVVLFFVTLAAILDAALVSLGDGVVLDALRRLCRTTLTAGNRLTHHDLRELVDRRLHLFSHSRAVQYVRSAAGEPRQDHGSLGGRASSLEVFHAASRRLIRALVSFLPLLGFLGTVIGLTAAIGSLPTDLGSGSGTDISGSLAGLAVKFETTLLGLTGGLIASLLLALVERREAELAGECVRLVEAASHDG